MGRPRPIYNEIKLLRKQLDQFGTGKSESTGSGAGSIKKCREAYTRLLEILGDPNTRQQLAEEAIPDHVYDDNDDDDDGNNRNDYGNANRYNNSRTQVPVLPMQRTALSEMWKTLIISSIYCVQNIISHQTTRKRKGTKTFIKYNENDINFPHQLLKLCFMYDPIFDSKDISSSNYHNYNCNNKQTQRHNTNFTPCKIGKGQSKLLYNYCITLLSDLDNDGYTGTGTYNNDNHAQQQMEAITNYNNNDTKIEQIILSMLLFICGRVELVAYYKSQHHIRTIVMNIIQQRILLPELQQQQPHHPPHSCYTHDVPLLRERMIISCKIWYTLFTSCTTIGIGLQYNIVESIELFSTWCQQQLSLYINHNSVHQNQQQHSLLREETMYILNTISILLRTDPDLCVESMKRHGQIILSFIQQCYVQQFHRSAIAATTIWIALLDFLLQYMYV
jgi:hypothetical protein